ncbi:MAG TPA: glycosyl transferase family 1 [Telluria sp.]|nr:glycosyl transferase family 1 [Telluria sp.]
MNVLFIHQNFPGQFVHLSANLAAQKGNRVVALAMRENPAPKNVQVRKYSLLRSPAAETHPMLRDEESKVLRAEACAAAAFQLKRDGFEPDVIVAHPGWGEALFIKDVFPNAKLVVYCEYYYAAEGQDVGFDPEDPPLSFQQRCRIRMKNTTNLLSLEMADAAISPTEWQKSTYPQWARDKITVIHDGIDFTRLKFNPDARVTLAATEYHPGLTFKPGDEVLSFVARNLEPVRGFPMLMRTLPQLLRNRPDAHAIILGGDEISYGHPAPSGGTWRQELMEEVGSELDMTRVHFAGKVPYQSYLNLLHVSKVHAYWTTPFVLSWSFLEAACSGLNTIASATVPVLEFAECVGVKTIPFFDRDAYVDELTAALGSTRKRAPVKEIAELQIAACVKRQKKLLAA